MLLECFFWMNSMRNLVRWYYQPFSYTWLLGINMKGPHFGDHLNGPYVCDFTLTFDLVRPWRLNRTCFALQNVTWHKGCRHWSAVFVSNSWPWKRHGNTISAKHACNCTCVIFWQNHILMTIIFLLIQSNHIPFNHIAFNKKTTFFIPQTNPSFIFSHHQNHPNHPIAGSKKRGWQGCGRDHPKASQGAECKPGGWTLPMADGPGNVGSILPVPASSNKVAWVKVFGDNHFGV